MFNTWPLVKFSTVTLPEVVDTTTATEMASPADIVMFEKLFLLESLYQAVRERSGETSDEYVANYLLTNVFGSTIGSNGENDTGK